MWTRCLDHWRIMAAIPRLTRLVPAARQLMPAALLFAPAQTSGVMCVRWMGMMMAMSDAIWARMNMAQLSPRSR